MNEKAKQIQALFGRIATRYDLLNRVMSGKTDQRWRKKAIRHLPLKDSPRVLDLCAGTLDLTLGVLKQYPQAQITALDFAAAMLEQGYQKVPAPYQNQVNRVVADGMVLPLASESFDAVICGFGMRNITDNQKALEEIFRILKPQGRVIILEFYRPTRKLAKLFYATYGRWIIPNLGRIVAKDQAAYEYLFNSIQGYSSVEEAKQLFEKVGFQSVSDQPLTAGIASIVIGDKP